MATRFIFTPYGAEFPSSNFPQLMQVNNRPVLAFDAGTDEAARWTFVAPQSLSGTLTLIITFMMASATSGAVRFQALIEAFSDGDAVDLDAGDSFDTANSAGETVPATAGYIGQLEITLTNADSIVAGDLGRLSLNRDADGTSGTDDATGDCYVLAVEIRDTAS